MALRKIMSIEGEAYLQSQNGRLSLGQQKTAFSAYCKIATLTGDKTSGTATVFCEGDGYKCNMQYDVPFSVEDGAPNFIKQAYLHLKTLPDFKDATDC